MSKAKASLAPAKLLAVQAVVLLAGGVLAPLAVRRNSREANFHTGADQASLREAAARLARSPQDADAAEELGSASAAASRTARAI